MPRLRLVALVAAVVVAAVTLPASLTRVPPGKVALSAGRVHPAGWMLHIPGRTPPIVPSEGRIRADGIELLTKEGSRLAFRLELDYRIGTTLAPQLLRDVRSGTLDGAVTSLARRVVDEAVRRESAESLVESPERLEAPIAAALTSAGIAPSNLSFRSPVAEDLARRRGTEAVRALARPPARVLVIGWDGADWDSIRPLVAAGRMPNMARFLREGAHGDLRSYDPMFSPLLWTTVATGKAPTEHGIADFLVKDEATGQRRPITSDFRKVKALWNIFGDFGRRSAWVAWWASYPAETIDGVLVSDLLSSLVIKSGPDAAARKPGVATPADYLPPRAGLLVPWQAIRREEVARFFSFSEDEWSVAQEEVAHPKPKARDDKTPDDPVVFLVRLLSGMRTYHALAKDLVRSGVPFVAVYYEGVDMMGHRFQHYLPPRMAMVGEADFARFKDAVPRWYEYQDALLGDLLAATPPGTVVVVLSDHGFRTGALRPEGLLPYTKGQPVEWHRNWGIVAMRGPGIRAAELPPSSIYDIAPTLLYLEGLPLAGDMPGRLISAAFSPDIVRTAPPTTVASYERTGIGVDRAARAPVDPTAMEEMMANLRALGYVGGDPAPASASAGGATPPAGSSPSPGESEASAQTQYYYHRNLAVSYIRQGRFREAEAELLAANERQAFGKTYSMLSEVRAAQGRYADAAAALEEGWRSVPASMEPSSLLWIVELDLLAGDRAAAASAAERWKAQMQPGVALAVQARLKDAAGDAQSAATLYRDALSKDPLLVRAAMRLHEIDLSAGRPFAIEPFLLETLTSHPQVDAYWDLAGQFALARGEAESAVGRFKRARDLEPENGLYLGHLASAHAAAGRPEEARSALEWSDRFPPSQADAWMAIGAARDRLGDVDRAVAAFAAAKKAGLSGPGADIGTALALARAGRSQEARSVLAEASARFPDSAAVRELAARIGG